MVHCCYCCWYWRSYCTTDDLLMPTATLALSLSVSASVWHDWIWFDRISVQFIRGEELWKKRAWTITGTNRLCLHINTYLERHLLESQQPTACEPLARSDMIFLCFNRAHATCGMSTWISPLCSSNQSISQSHLRSLISRNDTPNSITLIHHRLSNFQTRFGIFELKSQLLTCTLYALNWEKKWASCEPNESYWSGTSWIWADTATCSVRLPIWSAEVCWNTDTARFVCCAFERLKTRD